MMKTSSGIQIRILIALCLTTVPLIYYSQSLFGGFVADNVVHVSRTQINPEGDDDPPSVAASHPLYECPSTSDDLGGNATAKGHNMEGDFEEFYSGGDQGDGVEPIFRNRTYFLKDFRRGTFDGWDRPYRRVVKDTRDFVSRYVAPHLRDGDAVYESACGVGLRLYALLEVLAETSDGTTNLVVYGNEWSERSARRADWVLDALASNDHVRGVRFRKGRVCRGDSADLESGADGGAVVPPDSFDLVFTGYVTPLLDPLRIGEGYERNFARMHRLCERTTTWEATKLLEIAQRRQDEWWSEWFRQMVRIAKPGRPVVVEQASYPLCEDLLDYGGVPKSFWSEGVERFGWDVDPSSLLIHDDKVTGRYNVFFLKSKAR